MANINPLLLPIIQNGETINEGHFAVLAEKINEIVNAIGIKELITTDNIRFAYVDRAEGIYIRTMVFCEIVDIDDFSLSVVNPSTSAFRLSFQIIAKEGAEMFLNGLSSDANAPTSYTDYYAISSQFARQYDSSWISPNASKTITKADFDGVTEKGVLLTIVPSGSTYYGAIPYDQAKVINDYMTFDSIRPL